MALIYLLLSLVASAVQEILASVIQARAANLLRGLISLFSGDVVMVDDKPVPFVEALFLEEVFGEVPAVAAAQVCRRAAQRSG